MRRASAATSDRARTLAPGGEPVERARRGEPAHERATTARPAMTAPEIDGGDEVDDR